MFYNYAAILHVLLLCFQPVLVVQNWRRTI